MSPILAGIDSRRDVEVSCVKGLSGQSWYQAQAPGEAGMLFVEFLTKELGRIKVQSKLY